MTFATKDKKIEQFSKILAIKTLMGSAFEINNLRQEFFNNIFYRLSINGRFPSIFLN